MIKDTHYRSQFETNTSSGSLGAGLRDSWEKNLFGDAYLSPTVKPFDKVKYGVLNTTYVVVCFYNFFSVLFSFDHSIFLKTGVSTNRFTPSGDHLTESKPHTATGTVTLFSSPRSVGARLSRTATAEV